MEESIKSSKNKYKAESLVNKLSKPQRDLIESTFNAI